MNPLANMQNIYSRLSVILNHFVGHNIVTEGPIIHYILWFIAFFSLATAAVVVIYRRLIRPRYPVAVNCWFCNHTTTVGYYQQNCWDCPVCQQYNGFAPDGDYNKTIAAQREELLNPVPTPQQNWFPNVDQCNGLCQTCNINQQLKVAQLSVFVPSCPDAFDEEIEVFRKYLEYTYALCRNCEAVVRQKLGRQDSFLLPQLLNHKKSMTCSVVSSISNTKKMHYRLPWKYLCLVIVTITIALVICVPGRVKAVVQLLYPGEYENGYITTCVVAALVAGMIYMHLKKAMKSSIVSPTLQYHPKYNKQSLQRVPLTPPSLVPSDNSHISAMVPDTQQNEPSIPNDLDVSLTSLNLGLSAAVCRQQKESQTQMWYWKRAALRNSSVTEDNCKKPLVRPARLQLPPTYSSQNTGYYWGEPNLPSPESIPESRSSSQSSGFISQCDSIGGYTNPLRRHLASTTDSVFGDVDTFLLPMLPNRHESNVTDASNVSSCADSQVKRETDCVKNFIVTWLLPLTLVVSTVTNVVAVGYIYTAGR